MERPFKPLPNRCETNGFRSVDRKDPPAAANVSLHTCHESQRLRPPLCPNSLTRRPSPPVFSETRDGIKAACPGTPACRKQLGGKFEFDFAAIQRSKRGTNLFGELCAYICWESACVMLIILKRFQEGDDKGVSLGLLGYHCEMSIMESSAVQSFRFKKDL